MNSESNTIKSHALKVNEFLDRRYLIQEKIAVGGMGIIYKALDTMNENFPLAIKVLHQGLQHMDQHVKRFEREVQLTTSISHPNVVKIFDLIHADSRIFFTMEYVAGSSLEDELERGTYPKEHFARLVVEIADGLRAIHDQGIYHRDLKPGNIMLQPDGSIKIIDFGISREARSGLTQKNVKVGSIFYIPPELWANNKPTPQSDYYSLGCTLYELCLGHPPFNSENPHEIFKHHMNSSVPRLPNSFPEWLDDLIQWLTAKKPKNRPANAQEIIDHVHKYDVESRQYQTFSDSTMIDTVRSGQGMMTTFPSLAFDQTAREMADARKTYKFALNATRPKEEPNYFSGAIKRKSKTVAIKMPKNAALIFEFEMPTIDFLFLGIFLISLNVFDGMLTNQGVESYGINAEGNSLLHALMLEYGAQETLLVTKTLAIAVVLILTVIARKSKMVKDLVGTLSLIYLFAAIIPWIYILYYR